MCPSAAARAPCSGTRGAVSIFATLRSPGAAPHLEIIRVDDVQDKLSQFITEEFAYERRQPHVAPEEPLLDGGLVDSVGVLRLAAFIEEHFDIQVEDEDLIPENFQTVRAVAAFVRSKAAAGA